MDERTVRGWSCGFQAPESQLVGQARQRTHWKRIHWSQWAGSGLPEPKPRSERNPAALGKQRGQWPVGHLVMPDWFRLKAAVVGQPLFNWDIAGAKRPEMISKPARNE